MSKPFIHAKSSAKQFGGQWQDYIEIHEFLDSSKAAIATNVHRALTHNTWFISVVIPRVFGEVFKRKSDGVEISSRDIAEQHVAEDYGNKFIPSAQDFLQHLSMEPWMQNGKGTPPSFALILGKKPAKSSQVLDGSRVKHVDLEDAPEPEPDKKLSDWLKDIDQIKVPPGRNPPLVPWPQPIHPRPWVRPDTDSRPYQTID